MYLWKTYLSVPFFSVWRSSPKSIAGSPGDWTWLLLHVMHGLFPCAVSGSSYDPVVETARKTRGDMRFLIRPQAHRFSIHHWLMQAMGMAVRLGIHTTGIQQTLLICLNAVNLWCANFAVLWGEFQWKLNFIFPMPFCLIYYIRLPSAYKTVVIHLWNSGIFHSPLAGGYQIYNCETTTGWLWSNICY